MVEDDLSIGYLIESASRDMNAPARIAVLGRKSQACLRKMVMLEWAGALGRLVQGRSEERWEERSEERFRREQFEIFVAFDIVETQAAVQSHGTIVFISIACILAQVYGSAA